MFSIIMCFIKKGNFLRYSAIKMSLILIKP